MQFFCIKKQPHFQQGSKVYASNVIGNALTCSDAKLLRWLRLQTRELKFS